VIYHDFSAEEACAAACRSCSRTAASRAGSAPSGFERAMTEACAYSEGSQTMVILDQLQGAHFSDQARLYHFVMTREWNSAAGSTAANLRNTVLVLISEQPLYHSLAKCSYRVWTDAQSAFLDYRPAEYGLGPDAQGLFAALAAVCLPLGAAPTPSEFQHLLTDLLNHARSEEQIRQSFFGRVESVDRARLYAPELTAPLRVLLTELERLLGADEVQMPD
jgi:hypothetical protein